MRKMISKCKESGYGHIVLTIAPLHLEQGHDGAMRMVIGMMTMTRCCRSELTMKL